MQRFQLRCAQLLGTFAPGALHTGTHGATVVVGGLDHWYHKGLRNNQLIPASEEWLSEFQVRDPTLDHRLLTRLGIDGLRTVPDLRREGPASLLYLPARLFPQWVACNACGRMQKLNPQTELSPGTKCGDKKDDKTCNGRMVQMRFVAACVAGHLQDVPWREITCKADCASPRLFFRDAGGGLQSITVECHACGRHTNLSGLTKHPVGKGTSGLGELLQRAGRAQTTCVGMCPWHHDSVVEECGRQLIGTLANALNLMFTRTLSSINLPLKTAGQAGRGAAFAAALDPYRGRTEDERLTYDDAVIDFPQDRLRGNRSKTVRRCRKDYPKECAGLSDDDILAVVDALLDGTPLMTADPTDSPEGAEAAYRRQERVFLRQQFPAGTDVTTTTTLRCCAEKTVGLGHYSQLFSALVRVTRLQHTAALCGFDRIHASAFPPDSPPLLRDEIRRGLRQLFTARASREIETAWLPAQIVHGEGIYLELDWRRVEQWLDGHAIQSRFQQYARLVQDVHGEFRVPNFYLNGLPIDPRALAVYSLVHSCSHALMREMIFSCGYSGASLAERLYVSTDAKSPMAGMLIYTASGDAQGSMGGLSELGRPGRFAEVLARAMGRQTWCSSDPVCIEASANEPQAGINLCACHGCLLVPETACETRNRILDRATLVGTPADSYQAGFFSSVVQLAGA